MRLAAAYGAVAEGLDKFASSAPSLAPPWLVGSLELAVGGVLVVGFLTPIAGAAAAVGNIAVGAALHLASLPGLQDKALTVVDPVVLAISIVLLGPGAYSLDAHLFGRREIIIPEAPRPHSS